MAGYLEITFGPMFSGKTSNLIEKINNYLVFQELKKTNGNILVINSSRDSRNIDKRANLSTHNPIYSENIFKGKIKTITTEKLNDIEEEVLKSCDYIAIDESQFFEDLEEFVKSWLQREKFIHCAGLIADSDKKSFGKLNTLFCLADNIIQLKAFCVFCKSFNKTATFTKWSSKSCKNEKIHIGASDKYIPVCGKHFNNC